MSAAAIGLHATASESVITRRSKASPSQTERLCSFFVPLRGRYMARSATWLWRRQMIAMSPATETAELTAAPMRMPRRWLRGHCSTTRGALRCRAMAARSRRSASRKAADGTSGARTLCTAVARASSPGTEPSVAGRREAPPDAAHEKRLANAVLDTPTLLQAIHNDAYCHPIHLLAKAGNPTGAKHAGPPVLQPVNAVTNPVRRPVPLAGSRAFGGRVT